MIISDQFKHNTTSIINWPACCQVRTTGYGYPAHCAAEHAKDHKNILFIGNSYTYGNDLPGMVKNLASAAGGLSVSASD